MNTKRMLARSFGGALLLAALAATGCVAEIGDEEDSLGSVQLQSWTPWQPTQWQSLMVGTAGGWDYMEDAIPALVWYNDGSGCRGTKRSLCRDETFMYTVPAGHNFNSIQAMGRRMTDGKIFTWYTTQKFSVGTKTNLSAHQEPKAFTLPLKPWSTTERFGVLDLIEADDRGFFIAPFRDPIGDQWVFYWNHLGRLFRTIGTPSNPSSISEATAVAVPSSHGQIRGIHFYYGHPDCKPSCVVTHYEDGQYNDSSDSLNLLKP